MSEDLLIIKKYYGEKLMHLCRQLFPTIIDNDPGVLSKILLDTFNPSHFLYDDIIANECQEIFKEYLYSIYYDLNDRKEEKQQIDIADPVTLMHQAGYTLYECHTEEDINAFKKYYASGEELCTFNDKRLDRCYVYFAVKDGADKLNRNIFTNPRRQDAYGTSVISIQFTKDKSHTLSIKNRYNHTVSNPDATFSNDLDNIIPGLTDSFAEYYGMTQQFRQKIFFHMPYYVQANDGKFYRFNYEINNIYYCPGNIIIDNFEVKKLPKEKYLVFDYFVLDLVNKEILYDINDSFSNVIGLIKKITITNESHNKIITITPITGQDIILKIDKYNRLISYINNNVEEIPHDFLKRSRYLQEISLPNMTKVGDNFLCNTHELTEISFPNLEEIGVFFIGCSRKVERINLPKLKIVGDAFVYFCSPSLTEVSLPSVVTVGADFMRACASVTKIDMPNLETADYNFFHDNHNIKEINLPKLYNNINNPRLFNLINEKYPENKMNPKVLKK